MPIPGGWYTTALASGEWAHMVTRLEAGEAVADHILTHTGRLNYLPDNQFIPDETQPVPQIPRECAPLFIRMGRDKVTGAVKLAGKCWGRRNTYVEYNFATRLWQILRVDADSAFPVIYDLEGRLRINRTPDVGDLGAMGIKYVDPSGVLVSGDATYAPTFRAPKMSEWTLLPCGLVIGQGHEVGGVVVYDGVHHRRLAEGDCKAVNADEGSVTIAIGFYRERKDLGTYAYEGERVLTTEADLRALPLIAEPPPPPPPPPPGPKPMKIPANIQTIGRTFFARFPAPIGDSGDEHWLDVNYRNPPTGVMARFCEQLRYSIGGECGSKRRNSSAPRSAGSFAIKDGTIMHVFDIMVTVGSGRIDWDVDSQDVRLIDGDPDNPKQEFVPVQPINHLAAVVPTPGRAKIARNTYGVDAFDLNGRVIGLGDARYVEQVLVPTQLASRQFFYGTPLSAPRVDRDMATGLQQMRQLLPMMRAKKTRGSLFTVLNGTRNNGLSWQDALAYCREVNALALQFPELVIGFDLFNENLQSFEQDYAVNPQFLKEAEACFDLRFSVSPGATWGDQPPFMACGSHLVAHGDRALLPDAAARLMVVEGWDTVDREGMGITEVGRTAGRQRVDNPQWAAWQIAAMKKYHLAASFLHIDAGMTCNVDELGPVQRAAIALYAAEVGVVVTPPDVNRFLDTDMRDTPAWYPIFVQESEGLDAAIADEYTRVHGHRPATSDIRHNIFRGSVELERFVTMRRAVNGE